MTEKDEILKAITDVSKEIVSLSNELSTKIDSSHKSLSSENKSLSSEINDLKEITKKGFIMISDVIVKIKDCLEAQDTRDIEEYYSKQKAIHGVRQFADNKPIEKLFAIKN